MLFTCRNLCGQSTFRPTGLIFQSCIKQGIFLLIAKKVIVVSGHKEQNKEMFEVMDLHLYFPFIEKLLSLECLIACMDI